MNEQSGISKSQRSNRGNRDDIRGDNYGRSNGSRIEGSDSVRGHSDSGGASRYFPNFSQEDQHLSGQSGNSQILVGDCREVMASMPENSVDAIVTDPPYGLEFMGKEWDRFDGGQQARWKGRKNSEVFGDGSFKGFKTPSYGKDSRNRKCKLCGHYAFSGTPCQCPQPEWEIRAGTPPNMAAFQQFTETWAVEAMRVLKPGGFLLAFGGTRTYHRMVCAIEDAGFEIRDSLHWIYGSGFPKSLDVSKQIDKMARRDYVEAAIRLGLEIPGNSHHDWTKAEHTPSDKWWERFKEVLSPEEWKAIEREVVGQADRKNGDNGFVGGDKVPDLTAPSTDQAKEWQGWGTALKPAHEIVACAQKPFKDGDYAAIIGSRLGELERRLCTLLSAKDAEEHLGLSRADYDAACASAQWTAEEKSNIRDALFARMATSHYVKAIHTSLNIVWSWRAILAALLDDMSMSTTETVSGLTTDLKTLSFLLSQTTPEDIIRAATEANGLSVSALPAAQAFSAVDSRLNATHTLSALASATSGERTSPQDGAASPAHEPIVMARKPLSEKNVASNVLKWGTGAINVDQSRVGTNAGWSYPNGRGGSEPHHMQRGERNGLADAPTEATKGRWPPNLLLSHHELCRPTGEMRRVKGSAGGGKSQRSTETYESGDDGSWNRPLGKYNVFPSRSTVGHADPDGFEEVERWECVEGCPILEMDRQSGQLKNGGQNATSKEPITGEGGAILAGSKRLTTRYAGDSGGASRFFPRFPSSLEPPPFVPFLYQAKSSRAERNKGLEGMETITSHTPMAGRGQPGLKCRKCNRWKVSGNPCDCPEPDWEQSKFERPQVANTHPTVKPLALMRWLVRLVCPPGGTVLDPFMGSGSTGCAAVQEGFNFVGVEMDESYAEIARRRIAYWSESSGRLEKPEPRPNGTPSTLF